MYVIKILGQVDIGYFVTADNNICSNYGAKVVDDPKTCEKAAGEIRVEFKGTEDVPNYPAGCYLSKREGVYFNLYSKGSSTIDAKQICKTKGKW